MQYSAFCLYNVWSCKVWDKSLITIQTDANVKYNLHFIDLHHSVSDEFLKELNTLEIWS